MTFEAEVYQRRRRRFMEAVGPGAAAIFPGAPECVRSNDVEYLYRQNTDFEYLTGFREPGAVCVLLPGHPKEEYVLFVRPRDRERETWTGRRAGIEGAIERFGASAAYSIEELDQRVLEYLAERERLYYAIGRDDAFNQRVIRWIVHMQAARARDRTTPTSLLDPRDIVHEMRLHKEPEEIGCMRRAVEITAAGHAAAMRRARPGCHEYEIEALLEYHFRSGGASGPAYPSIVASGPNATVLHYTTNDRIMREGELLLIDAGAEYDGYCADVSRTFPVGVRFEGRGRELYEIVLSAQLAAIDSVRPGATIESVHERAVEVLVEGLLELGLLSGSLGEIREKSLFKPFYMHRTSHWLGMDVHDVGKYKLEGHSRVLEPGMVLTVEPGIYIADHVENIAPKWHGLGVRIEDDVLVIPGGNEVLSARIPKAIGDIEALRTGG
jgi:Xaa-Pro aminopeptidase